MGEALLDLFRNVLTGNISTFFRFAVDYKSGFHFVKPIPDRAGGVALIQFLHVDAHGWKIKVVKVDQDGTFMSARLSP